MTFLATEPEAHVLDAASETSPSEAQERWYQQYAAYIARVGESRAVRAAFRKNVLEDPKTRFDAHPYLSRWVPDNRLGTSREWAVYTAAALYGKHPELPTHGKGLSIGAALGRLGKGDSSSGEFMRLRQLATSDVRGLCRRLLPTVSLLVSKGAAPDLALVARDINSWAFNRDAVTQRWVRDFVGGTPSVDPEEQDEENDTA